MKKILIPIVFLLTGLQGLIAQNITATISGTVTNSVNGAPVVNQAVYIYSVDSVNYPYSAAVYTNQYGYYADTLIIPYPSQFLFYVATSNCNGGLVTHTVVSSILPMVANFTIQCNQTGCTASYIAVPDTANPLTIQFINTSTGVNPSDTYYWSFGDGSTSAGANPSHTYLYPGGYNVCLHIINSSGNPVCSYCDSLFVSSAPACSASFQYTLNGNSVHFFAAQASNITSYTWTFGDGITASGPNSDPVHQYAAAGTYYVCLTITTSNGCTDTYCKDVVVGNNTNCAAYFYAYPDSSGTGYTYNFYDQSVANSGATITSWQWSFSDGYSSSAKNPIHTFTNMGVGYYGTCLTITTSTGCSASYCDSVYIDTTNTGCNAYFSYSVNGNSVHFFTPNSANTTYTWTFGDSITVSGPNSDPVHQYAAAGTYYVCLTIITTGGCIDTYCQNVVVGSNTNCSAYFYAYPDSMGTGLDYTFYDYSNPAGSNIVSWFWNFGDSTHSTLQYPTHSYAYTGYYTVCLTITTATGCSDTYCQTVYADTTNMGYCHGYFQFTVNNASVSFFGVASDPNSSYYWDFGDNTHSTQQNPVHYFNSLGTFYVCLTITTSNGCTDTYCNYVYTGNPAGCNASFVAYPDTFNLNSVYFYNTSTGVNPGDSYHWSFGDGTGSTQSNPSHTYQGPGYYMVCLNILDSTGNINCSYCDTLVVGANVYCTPYFQFNTSGNIVHFHGYSNTNAVSYFWNFGDSTTGTGQNPVHTYPGSGTYYACLTVVTASGCTGTFCKNIVIGSNTNNSTICGQVFAGNTFADAGYALLIAIDPTTNQHYLADTASLDSAGNYCFNNIIPGDYLVLAFLTPGSAYFLTYMPTYYGDSIHWYDANIISVTAGTSSSGYDINLVLLNGTNFGPGYIIGIVMNGLPKGPGEPMEGVEIILLDAYDKPLASVFSDANGKFNFDNLAYGTYKIYGEVAGRSCTPAIIKLDGSNPGTDDVQVTVGLNNVYASVGDEISEYYSNIGSVYPNPSADNAVIEVSLLKSAEISVSIFNMIGQEAAVYNVFVNTGKVKIPVYSENLEEGIYTVQLSTPDGMKAIRKFTKIR